MKIEILKEDKEHKVMFSQGCQHFVLDYRGSKEECEWVKHQLWIAFRTFKKGSRKCQ